MTYWLTKGTSLDREYIVLKHLIPGTNAVINGIKFRGGYCVVEKDSKAYHSLKKMPMLKGSKELPLLSLRTLPFITRSMDVFHVFGKDVYNKYMELLQPVVEEEIEERVTLAETQHLEFGKCHHRKPNGELCGLNKLEPSNNCMLHVLEDPILKEIGFHIPRMVAKDEKQALRERALRAIEKHVKEELKNNGN